MLTSGSNFDIVKLFSPLIIAFFVIAIIKFLFDVVIPDLVKDWRIRRQFNKGTAWRSDRDLLHWMRGMSPTEFEEFIAELFQRMGYRSEAVGRSHDGGIDVVIEKNGIKNYIQCKKFITSTVSVGAVRDFYGALADHLTNGKGYFITTNKFTLEAERFAEDKPIELVDGFKLVHYVRLVEKENNQTFNMVSEVQVNKFCPKCGGQLIKRDSKFGKFFGCSNYPKCHYTKNLVDSE